MDRAEKRIIDALKTGNFLLSAHAARRMNERSVTIADIRACGRTARFCIHQALQGTWRIEGEDLDMAVIEREIACEIVRQGIPIKGAEVKFLRKSLGLSLENFGRLLGLTAPGILKWERARAKRLAPINEVAVRALMAEQLDIKLEGRFTILRGNLESPSRLYLKVA